MTTERLILRQWLPKDAARLIGIVQEEHIQTWMPDWANPQEWIAQWIERVKLHMEVNDPQKAFLSWAITRRSTNEIIGQISMGSDEFDGEKISIAYFLSDEYVGHGYMTEAVEALLVRAKDTWHFAEIHALVRPDNEGSLGVVKRTGFEFAEGIDKVIDEEPVYFEHWVKFGDQ